MASDVLDVVFPPGHGSCRMFVKEVSAGPELLAVKTTNESKVYDPFIDHLLHLRRVHLLEIQAVIPNREWRARGRANDPIRLQPVQHANSSGGRE